MPSPLELLRQYRNLRVTVVENDLFSGSCREIKLPISLRTYFMMSWDAGSEERRDFNHVTRGGRRSDSFRKHRDAILNAAMGKGSPRDYELALEWAVMSGKIANPTQMGIQTFCDQRLGIDCSGFVTNYLIACGKKPNTPTTARNTGAASYFSVPRAVNDPTEIRQGDLLVWMRGNSVRRSPGHIAVVESYRTQSLRGGNMRVVEATGAAGANPKLLDSMYEVEQIIDPSRSVPCMILVVKRHGVSGSRVSVMRY